MQRPGIIMGRGVFAAGLVIVLSMTVGGCGDAPPPRDETPADAPAANGAEAREADPRKAEVLSAGEYLEIPRFANADFSRGERLFLQCRACHTLGEDDAHRPTGPNLWGMWGQPAAQRDWNYSDALRNADIVWTPASMDEWLARPSSFVPGNRMQFAGMRSADDRADLIAWLLVQTSEAEQP